MSEHYFVSEATGNRYKVVKFDKETGVVLLRGKFGEFTERYDKKKFKRMGYELVTEEDGQ